MNPAASSLPSRRVIGVCPVQLSFRVRLMVAVFDVSGHFSQLVELYAAADEVSARRMSAELSARQWRTPVDVRLLTAGDLLSWALAGVATELSRSDDAATKRCAALLTKRAETWQGWST